MGNNLVNFKLEQRLLLIALDHPNVKGRNLVLAQTRPEDFGTEEGKEVRTRIEKRFAIGKPPAGAEEFSDDPGLSKEARQFLKVEPKVLSYCKRVKSKQVKELLGNLERLRKIRGIYEGINTITETLSSGKSDEETLKQAEEQLDSTTAMLRQTSTQSRFEIGGSMTRKEVNLFIKDLMTTDDDSFVPTGIDGLDREIGGAGRGELIVVAAPRGGGKSAMMIQSAINQYRDHKQRVAIWSMEMSKQQMQERILACMTGERHADIRFRKKNDIGYMKKLAKSWYEFNEIGQAPNSNNARLTLWDISDASVKPTQLQTTLSPFGYDCIWVDYLTLFDPGRKDLWQAQKAYSRYFKQLAKQLNCVIVLLTQLSDEGHTKYGRGPEEDADWFLWWRYGDEEVARGGQTDIKVDKARHGKKGYIQATFAMASMQILFGTGLNPTSRFNETMTNMKGKKKDNVQSEDQDLESGMAL